MKKTIVLLAALLVSCVSAVPARVSNSECLVVIKTETINPNRAPEAIIASLVLSNGAVIKVPRYSTYLSTVVEERGILIQSVRLSPDTNQNIVGQSQEYPVSLELPYRAGHIVFAQAFSEKFTKGASGGVDYLFQFRPVTDDERAEMKAALEKNSHFASWDHSD